MRQWLTLLAVAIGSGVATQVNDYLTTDLSVGDMAAAILSGCAGVAVYEVAVTVIKWFLLIAAVRRAVDTRALFEGFWISRTTKDGKAYHNLIHIFFETASDGYSATGTALDQEGKLHASWSGSELSFELKESTVRFLYESNMLPNVEDLVGFAAIKFHRTGSGRYTTGEGYIVEAGTNCAKYSLLLNRLPPDKVKLIIGKNEPATHGEREVLIKGYCANHPNF